MDLTLKRRGDYAVRAAIALAREADSGRAVKNREIASEMGLPFRYTPQILRLLARAGLAEARAGRGGGYRLTRRPKDISLLEVVEAAEGPLAPERCTLRGGPCRWDDMCAVHPSWEAATEALRASLGAVTLADVSEVDRGLESGTRQADASSHGKRASADSS
jgi:Rrf2 family protein